MRGGSLQGVFACLVVSIGVQCLTQVQAHEMDCKDKDIDFQSLRDYAYSVYSFDAEKAVECGSAHEDIKSNTGQKSTRRKEEHLTMNKRHMADFEMILCQATPFLCGYMLLTQHYVHRPGAQAHVAGLTEGLQYFKRLTELQPTASLLVDYATACRWVKDNESAEQALLKALELEPENIMARGQLGYVVYNSGRQMDGLKILRDVVVLIEQLYPDKHESWTLGDIQEFVGFYQTLCDVFSIIPEFQEQAYILASSGVEKFPTSLTKGLLRHTHKGSGKLLATIEQNNVEQASIHFESGKSLSQKGDLMAAAKEFLIACELLPTSPVAHYSAAMTLRFVGQHELAFQHAETAWKLEPGNMMFFNDYMHLLRSTCRWHDFKKHWPIVQNALDTRDLDTLQHFRLSGIYWGFSMEMLYTLSSAVTAPPETRVYKHTPDPSQIRRKLRIAYISSNYRNHAQGTQMTSFFKEHDREKFEVYAFSLIPALTDEAKKRRDMLKPQMDHWIEVHDMDARQTAKVIYDNKIDIAVDLCGQADHPRTETYSFRPSPVQISFLGYPGTTGVNFIDYYIGDPISTPIDMMGSSFSERLILMPHTYQITEHKQEHPIDSFTNPNPNPRDTIVFCNFNQPVKIEFDMFTAWMDILKAVPNSVLWLLSQSANNNMHVEAKRQGVDPKRIIFLASVDKSDHLKRMQNADLLLDTTIYNAHTSAGDALWAGLPVVTILGDTMPSRVCSSMLLAAGLPELITNSFAEYKALAIELGSNRTKLQDLRQRIAAKRTTMPLFDTPKYTKDLELALQEVWRKFSSGEDPETFEVASLPEYKSLQLHSDL